MLNPVKNNKMLGGVMWGMAGTAGQAVFQLIVFIILARALSPEEFGVVAIATAMIDLLNFIGRCGISEVLIQRKSLTDRALNSGFFASIIAGIALTLALYGAAPLFAATFRTPDLLNVIRLLSPVCLLYAAGAVYEASLRHACHFKQLALRNTTATVVSGIAAVVMALQGYGVYSLIAQRLIATVWTLAAMMIATRWLPGLDVDRADMWALTKRGSAIAVSSVLGAGNQRLVDLVVGYFLGPTPLGYLRIAWRMLDLLLEIAVRPISNVSLTFLSKARHDDRGLNTQYVSLIRYSSLFIVPMFIGLAATAQDVIPLIFGQKWLISAQLLSILCLMGFFYPLIYFKSNALIAHGAYRHVVMLNVAEFAVSMATAMLFAPFGLVSATVGNVVRTAIATPMILLYLKGVLGIAPWTSIRATGPAILAGSSMLLTTYAAKLLIPASTPPYARIAACIAAGLITYCGLIAVLERDLFRQLRLSGLPKDPIAAG